MKIPTKFPPVYFAVRIKIGYYLIIFNVVNSLVDCCYLSWKLVCFYLFSWHLFEENFSPLTFVNNIFTNPHECDSICNSYSILSIEQCAILKDEKQIKLS